MFCRWCLEITYAVVNNLDALYLLAINTLALVHINLFNKLTENFSREFFYVCMISLTRSFSPLTENLTSMPAKSMA